MRAGGRNQASGRSAGGFISARARAHSQKPGRAPGLRGPGAARLNPPRKQTRGPLLRPAASRPAGRPRRPERALGVSPNEDDLEIFELHKNGSAARSASFCCRVGGAPERAGRRAGGRAGVSGAIAGASSARSSRGQGGLELAEGFRRTRRARQSAKRAFKSRPR